jgi:16S rRNA (cytidine1402-2'-O)-methyltransferase
LGQLTLITVPIGNLGDLTERSRQKLEQGDFFLAEDTRMLRSLLGHLGISDKNKTIQSFHDHSAGKMDWILGQISQREEVCLVSDAGSPMISDPAFPLVLRAIEDGHKIESCPGASSVIVALELSGLPPIPFHFHGFLPREKGKRKQFFNSLIGMYGTHIFFESPHRVIDSLDDMVATHNDAEIAVARELTKKFETIHRFNSENFDQEREKIAAKGEFVLLLHLPKTKGQKVGGEEFVGLAKQYLEQKRTPKQLAKLLGAILGQPTSEVYQELVKKN